MGDNPTYKYYETGLIYKGSIGPCGSPILYFDEILAINFKNKIYNMLGIIKWIKISVR